MEEYPVKKSFNSLARPGPRAGFFKSELVRSKVFFLMVNIFALLPFSSFRTLDLPTWLRDNPPPIQDSAANTM